jgi:hypothetical protein
VNTNASAARVGVDYFRTLGIPLLAGREFTDADIKGSPQVAVVNEAFARKFNLVDRVIGKRMALGAGTNGPLDIEIVGLVRDAKYDEVRDPAPPQFVMPYRQVDTGGLTFYVRAGADMTAVLRAIPTVVRRLDANIPISNLRTMEDQIRYDTSGDRALTITSSALAVLAVSSFSRSTGQGLPLFPLLAGFLVSYILGFKIGLGGDYKASDIVAADSTAVSGVLLLVMRPLLA